MKKLISMILCAAMVLCMSACNKYGEYSEYTQANYQAQSNNNVDVYFVGANTYRDPMDYDYVIVTVNVTNNSTVRGNYFIYLKAFQDDIPLSEQNFGKLGDVFDSDNQKRYLDPGSSADYTFAFELKNRTDDVTVYAYNMNTDKQVAMKIYTFN